MPPRAALTKGPLELKHLPRANHFLCRELYKRVPGPEALLTSPCALVLVLGFLDIRICTCDSREHRGTSFYSLHLLWMSESGDNVHTLLVCPKKGKPSRAVLHLRNEHPGSASSTLRLRNFLRSEPIRCQQSQSCLFHKLGYIEIEPSRHILWIVERDESRRHTEGGLGLCKGKYNVSV